MIVLDTVYTAIKDELASYAPERGGALYGPKDLPLVTRFELDEAGRTTSVSYTPSLKLIANIKKIEIAHPDLRFKGIIHSHPDNIVRPSSGDCSTIAGFFKSNQHIGQIALPIVQRIREKSDSGFLYWYRAEKTGKNMRNFSLFGMNDAVNITDEEFFVLPLHEHVQFIVRELAKQKGGIGLYVDQHIQALELQGANFWGILAKSQDGKYEFMYFVTIDYPKASPFVLYQDKGATKNLEVIWNATKQEENLQGVIAGLLQAWGHGTAKIDRADAGTSMSNRSKINDAPLGGLVVANQKKEGGVRKLLSGLEKVAKSPPGRER